MAENVVRQRLAAILAADVAGYSRLMGADERATIDAINSCRAVFREQIEANGGRVMDMAGDSVLAIFDTAIGAFTTAMAAQEGLASLNADIPDDRRMAWRIGVNLGDIHEQDDGTVYGDGVNVAARLEALSEPGGICLSDKVHTEVRGKIDRAFADLGEHDVKNIAEPVRAYRVLAEGEVAPARPKRTLPLVLAGAAVVAIVVAFLWPGEYDDSSPDVIETAAPDGALPPLPTGPSIAVLPFDNLGGDPEQEYFADGLAEDILTRLAAFQDLKVIARNSSFQYKGEAVDVREVGRDLGADFVLEGSVRRDAGSIRVSAQLLETKEGGHVWAENYDRDLSVSGIFAIQDEITEQVTSALGGAMGAIAASEIRRVQGATTDNLRSYECVLLAKQYLVLQNQNSHLAARDCLEQVVATETTYVEALVWLGEIYMHEIWSGFNPRETGPSPLEAAFDVLGKAVQLDPNHQRARSILAWAYYTDGDAEQFYDEARKAVAANPNDVETLATVTMFLGYAGRWDDSKELAQRIRGLGDNFPNWHNYTEFNYHYRDKDYAAAATSARATLEIEHWAGPWYLALAYAGMGEDDKTMEALAKARALEPNLSTEMVRGMLDALFLDQTHIALLMDGHAQLLALEESLATRRPVIAVLPFDNMSGDPEQEYFADGLAEDLITRLAQYPDLAVIARNSSFQYKGQAVDVRRVADELGASYILEGSVRRSGNRLRVVAQLLDATDGTHVWTKTFERDLSTADIFDIQDEITTEVTGNIGSEYGILMRLDQSAAKRKPPGSLASYDCVALARAHLEVETEENHAIVKQCLERAVESDPEYAEAWAFLSEIYAQEHYYGFNVEPNTLDRTLEAARRAVEVAPGNQIARRALASAYYHRREKQDFIAETERTIAINPNDAGVLGWLGSFMAMGGEWDRGMELLNQAIDLNPLYPDWWNNVVSYHYYLLGDYERSLIELKKGEIPDQIYYATQLVALYAELGKAEKLQEALASLQAYHGDVSIADTRSYLSPFVQTDSDVERLLDGLRKAGLPEGTE
jgi:adenylate cyclase